MKKAIRNFLSKLPIEALANPAPVVSVLPLEGVIGSSGRFSSAINLANLEEKITAAFEVYNAKAVALTINSPGGSPVQSELIVMRIRELSKEKDIPVYAFAEDVAASGGYMLSLAADEIYAHQASIVGSIGVINAGFGYPGAIEKLGIERRVYTAGESKSLMDPFKPEVEKDVKLMKALLKEVHDFFKAFVKEARGDKLKGVQKTLFSGQVWNGEEATKLGLIDGVGDMRSVMKDKLGDDVKFKRIKEEKGFLKGMLGMHMNKASIADDVIKTLETRSEWGRFGL
ncbi:S49 family peptidase [Emcibacteraceae bacterium]|jgi:signal peptide peptidase SppA|uniref:S49 family peptidase n=1 Tax=Pseudemcibacter sp. TaxID=2943293 RepID=UPI00230DE4CE|nr:S49 family peptidase [Kordiimonadaceae bacterium]MDA9553638.1 S49 family peptidase [Emcibacteraceae bacterium]MDA9769855.1 S49 family peptidase [Emcibacteraceae bacterium]MDG1020692.1 S49 family peptidase [Emcibacteraceae bacterium]MDG1725741.1 S49 family peptidase [Emcibacteraceae bacterium]